MNKQDFEGMEFDPFAAFGNTLITTHYPRLGKIKGFSYLPEDYEAIGWKAVNLSRLLKFVIIFIDKQSPLFDERDVEKRKRAAMKVLGIKKEDLEYPEIIDERELFREYVFEYFRLINDMYYEQWFTLKHQIHTFNKYLRKPLTSDPDKISAEVNARKGLTKEIDNFTDKLQSLEAVIFDDERLAAIINEKTVQNSIGSFAEQFAQDPEWHNH